jgi:hypothetical protein
MASVTTSRQPVGSVAGAEDGGRATRIVVGTLGALVGAAGIEHGVGEFLQGPVPPDGPLIMSWPDAAALEILSGEPAMTVLPDLRVTGVLAVTVALALMVWSIWFVAHRHGGLVLVGLSVLLLLVGGGLAPPLMGVVLGLVAARIGTTPRRSPPRVVRALAGAWPWFLGAALVGYLGLMPGMVIASSLGMASETAVVGLGVLAFSGFGLALATARADDRLRPADR